MKHRIVILLIGGVLGLSVLLMRLFDVQVARGHQFLVQADSNRFYDLPLLADRGVFLDRYQQPLVWNRQQYFEAVNPQALYTDVQPITRDQALDLMATDAARIRTQTARLYAFPESLSLVLGYIGRVSAEDLQQQGTLKAYHLIGKIGLERILDTNLRGKDGKEVYEIDARLRRQRLIETKPFQAGQNPTTTLDAYLSEVAYQALGDQRGAVLINDAHTGAVLAMVSKPSFNANLMTQVLTDPEQEKLRRSQVSALFANEHKPFFNRALSGVYPPGSVFKLVTALAGLEAAAFDEATTVVDEGVLTVGEYQYGNWFFRQHGRTEGVIGVERAIVRSNDIFFYKAAEWMGPDLLATMARRFGFGKQTGIELGNEASGTVPDPAWKQEVLGEPWYLGNTYHFGIGQGDLLVTPLQVAQMVQAIAHEGVACQPHVLETTQVNCSSLGVTPEHLETVLRGMLGACSPGGTAFPFFPRNERIREQEVSIQASIEKGAVACKTGTAEFGAANERGHRPTHAWFVAIVEPQLALDSLQIVDMNNPNASTSAKVVLESSSAGTLSREVWLNRLTQSKVGLPRRLTITVIVESDEANTFKEGSRDAAPVARKILTWIEGQER